MQYQVQSKDRNCEVLHLGTPGHHFSPRAGSGKGGKSPQFGAVDRIYLSEDYLICFVLLLLHVVFIVACIACRVG